MSCIESSRRHNTNQPFETRLLCPRTVVLQSVMCLKCPNNRMGRLDPRRLACKASRLTLGKRLEHLTMDSDSNRTKISPEIRTRNVRAPNILSLPLCLLNSQTPKKTMIRCSMSHHPHSNVRGTFGWHCLNEPLTDAKYSSPALKLSV